MSGPSNDAPAGRKDHPTAAQATPDPDSAAREGGLDKSAVLEALRGFVRSSPLLKTETVLLDTPVRHRHIEYPPTVAMPCPKCVSEQRTTWKLNQQTEAPGGVLLGYLCSYCGASDLTVWVEERYLKPEMVRQAGGLPTAVRVYHSFSVRKIGQRPPWSIDVPRPVQKALRGTAYLELYKCALISMSQGYGIGSLAYFRRLIEESTDLILDVVEEAARDDGDTEAARAVEQARTSRIAEHKLELVKDVLPPSLRPGGVNPLAVLHDQYSKGLHRLDEDSSLEVAMKLREAFDYVFGNLRELIDKARAFRESIQSPPA